jgi:uracil DNA glycosylase
MENTCFPPKDLIFQLSISVIFQFKMVIIGQDPYAGKGKWAVFSNDGVRFRLRYETNFQGINEDLNSIFYLVPAT